MAMQDNITISSPSFAAECSGSTAIAKKVRKKGQQELMQLATIVQALKKEIVSAKSEAKTATSDKIVNLNSNENAEPGDTNFGKAMAEMAFALEELEAKLSKLSEEKTGFDSEISKDQAMLATRHLNNLKHELKKIEHEKKKDKLASFWMKVADVVVAAVAAVVAVVTLQPELLIITAVSLAGTTGIFSDMTKGMAKVLGMIPGCPKEVANIVASVLVCAMVTAFAGFLGDPEEAADSIAEASDEIEMTTMNVGSESSIADTVETGGEQTEQTTMQKFKAALKKINQFNKLKKRTNLRLFAAAQTISSTGLVDSAAEGILNLTHASDKKKKEVELALTITMAIASILISLGTGAAAMEGSGASITKGYEGLISKLVSASRPIMCLGAAGEGAGGVTSGTYTIKQGELEEALTHINAELKLINEAGRMNNTQASDDVKHQVAMMRQVKTGDKAIASLMKGMAAFAELFTEFSPLQ